MKILIIGNGFDLAHYLPTAYAHFMGVMKAIEELPEGKTEVTYDDLFAGLEKENEFFFGRTREIYDGDNMKFDVEKIYELKENLKNNKWYSFFKMHMEINTWIDFEERVSGVLKEVCNFNDVFSENITNGIFLQENFSMYFSAFERRSNNFKISSQSFYCLHGFDLFRNSDVQKSEGSKMFKINLKYFKLHSDAAEFFLISKFLSDLSVDFFRFADVFDLYLNIVCLNFLDKHRFLNKALYDFDRVFSFNYTDTFFKFSEKNVKIDFLHGKMGSRGIVMGVSEISHPILVENKAYGFTKYHQKLLKNTDYTFLRGSPTDSDDNLFYLDGAELVPFDVIDIFFWGHSLDVSDGDYINEVFSFNQAGVRGEGCVRVHIYYHSELSKFDLLSNILHIVGREKIEKWMKKGWLKFEQAPDLYELNFSKNSK